MTRHWVLGMFGVVAIFLLLLSSNAYAKADHTGFDLSISISEPILYRGTILDITGGHAGGDIDYSLSDPFIGTSNFKISFGYRWKYVGVYLEQELGGIYWSEGNFSIVQPDYYQVRFEKQNQEDNKWFLGGTFICAHGIIPTNILDISFIVGFGMIYSSDGSNEEYPFLAKDGVSVPWPALKLGAALTYYYNDWFGLGINFDYNFAFMVFDYTEESNSKLIHERPKYDEVSVIVMIHHIVPGIHFQFHF